MKNYKFFKERYPKMPFSVISFDVDEEEVKKSKFPILNIWDL